MSYIAEVAFKNTTTFHDARQWFMENGDGEIDCQHAWYSSKGKCFKYRVLFELESDAVLFKLKWG